MAFGLGSCALLLSARVAVRQVQIDAFLWLAGAQAVLCWGGALLIWKGPPARGAFWIVLGLAAVLRLGLLFETPILSDDIYRYVWDGRVQSAGINPYRYIPVDPALAGLRDDAIFPRINRRTYAPTIYPPMAQMIFWAIHQASGSVAGFKASLLLFEAITIGGLACLLTRFGLPRERVLIYAWNPLVLWEFSGSGHIDAAMIAFVMLALVARKAERNTLTGVLLGAAVLTKFFPLALFPALYRRWDWKMPIALVGTIAAGYLPYLSVGPKVFGFLSTYADEEGIRSGRYFPLQLARFLGAEIPTGIYLGLVVLVLGALASLAVWRWNGNTRGFLFSAGTLAFAFTFCLSPQFPWYWCWTIPFLAFLARPALLPAYVFTVAALLHYGLWFRDRLWGSVRIHPHLALSLVHLTPAVLAVLAVWLLRRKPTAPAP